MQGRMKATGVDQEVNGTILLSGRQLKGRFRNMGFQMDMDINSRLSGKQLEEFTVALNGTEMKLFNGVFDNQLIEVDDQWWMTISAPNGYATLSTPATMEADVSLSMKDTRALIAVFAEIQEWLKYFDNVLTIKDVEGTGKISASDQSIRFQNIAVNSDKLELFAEIKADKDNREGIFWGKRGIFSLGVERIKDETHWKFIGGRSWYESRKLESWTSP